MTSSPARPRPTDQAAGDPATTPAPAPPPDHTRATTTPTAPEPAPGDTTTSTPIPRNPSPGECSPGECSPGESTRTSTRRATLRRRTPPALTAITGGLLLYLATPPVGAWPLAPLAVTLLTLTVRGRRLRASYALGFLFALAFFLPLLRFVSFVGTDAWIILAAAEAAILALVAPATTLVWRLPAPWLWTGAVWTAQEALRDRAPFGGFPWGRLAFTQSHSPLTPLVALAGAPTLTATVALLGALLAHAAPHTHHALRHHTWQHTPRPLAPPLLGALALTLTGPLVPLPTAAQNGTRTIAAIQGNVPADGGIHALGRAFQVTANHLTQTHQLAADVAAGRSPAPDLVLWPENSSDLDPTRDPTVAAALRDAARTAGAPVLIGAVLDGPGPGHVRNAGMIWTADGFTGQMYVKRHPVPFAEYLPGRALLTHLISRFADDMPSDFQPGHTPGALTAAGTTLGDVICFEVAYDDLVRDTIDHGAQILVIQTNNASFGRKGESQQQLAMSRLRAVEHGRATIQVSTSGQSALITPDGTLLATSGLYQSAVLTATLPLRTSRTLADRAGDLPEAVLLILGLGAMMAGAFHRRRDHTTSGPDRTRTTPQATTAPRDGTLGDAPRAGLTDMAPDQERNRVDHHRVVVCVPTYNERDNLQDTARRLRAANPTVDLLVIDDASPDGTGDIADALAAEDPHIHVLHRPGKSGLGTAYVAGFTWALEHDYTVIVEMDADGSHQPEQLPRLLAALDHADLAIGARWVPGGEVHNWPRRRLLLSRGANIYVRAALGMPLRDATAGYRAYRADVLRDRDLTGVVSQGYCFQVDLAWQAWRSGFRVTEVPITFVERARGTSKMSNTIVAEAFWRVALWAATHRRRPPTPRPTSLTGAGSDQPPTPQNTPTQTTRNDQHADDADQPGNVTTSH
ncbi:apolipoprotein N-acyltransferase [Frankia sp. AgB32]|uniref:apolipoprotein N-acyltransferase n=1 Tax=Frankia sp. AgB32 TaxID=631119 RepID=UPI00200F4E91|nr:apolipoprotein N-acyltransferase [Frankia sp. AgB32]